MNVSRAGTWVLAFVPLLGTAFADESTTGSGPQEGTTAEPAEVIVTGSRIRSGAATDLTPVTVITPKDLDKEGFRNVFDALNTLPQNTGFTQGADFGNTFTPAANAISLRGLGPNHTLILFDGRRVADYPIAYDGQVNFVDLATVPSAAIERIEILNGGASAIYGSDAIAGVVNIILKDHPDGLDFDAKLGTTERGGGTNGRLQASGGGTFGRLTALFAAEVSRTQPIWSQNRDFMNSSTLEGERPTSIWARQNLDTGDYISPADGCAGFARDFYGTVTQVTRGGGAFCGSGKARPAYWTVKTGNESQNFYGRLKYQLTDHASLFGDVILGWNRTWNNTRGPIWQSLQAGTGYFYNQNTAAYEEWTRRISPEEMGGAGRYDRYWKGNSAVAATGVRGDVAGTSWQYELAYSGSVQVSRDERPRLLSGVDSYFLGPQLGVDASGVPIYAPDAAKFDQPLTPAQFTTIFGRSYSKDTSWLQTVALTANGDLFQLPAGMVRAATVLEWGSQGFSNIPDPRINEGAFFNTLPVAKASGSRSRYAAATELSVPILEQVSARAAARFDDYSFAGRSNSKPTYNLGLEYRPWKSFLVRGNYATSFRAPDMNYIFQTLVRGYYPSTTDYYRCRVANEPLSNCEFANVSPGSNFIQTGSRDLRFENGRSFGGGVVWSPDEHLQLSVDYWNIRIDDLVTILDADTLLRIEADCRTGGLNINSAQCVDVLNRIQRNPSNAVLNPNAINVILVNPINAALERVDGYDVAGRGRFGLGGWGQLAWTVNFTKVLAHKFKQFATDQELDVIHSLINPDADNDFPDKLSATLTWSRRQWTSTVQLTRYGSIVNQAQTGYLTPTTIANVSAGWQITGSASVSVIVQNVFDTIKHDDTGGWPYYPVGYYLPYGREGWVEFSYHFGG
jgi:iron complex outermembrane receptor protein